MNGLRLLQFPCGVLWYVLVLPVKWSVMHLTDVSLPVLAILFFIAASFCTSKRPTVSSVTLSWLWFRCRRSRAERPRKVGTVTALLGPEMKFLKRGDVARDTSGCMLDEGHRRTLSRTVGKRIGDPLESCQITRHQRIALEEDDFQWRNIPSFQ